MVARPEGRSLPDAVAFDRRIVYVNALLVAALLVVAVAPVGSPVRTPLDVWYPDLGATFEVAVILLAYGAALWAYWRRGSHLIFVVDAFIFVGPIFALISLVPVAGGLEAVASSPLNLVSSVVICGLSLPTIIWLPSRSHGASRSA
jgi:hypothetical protein